MGKNKKKNKSIGRRPYLVPTDYIEAVADSIHQQQPTKEIIANTLSGVYSSAFAKGYGRRMSDDKYFHDKRSQRINTEWNTVKDAIDDYIHENK